MICLITYVKWTAVADTIDACAGLDVSYHYYTINQILRNVASILCPFSTFFLIFC